MQRGRQVGHILGIPLRIDASWLVVFALITWSLATAYFPEINVNWPWALYWLLGLMTSVLFFASVVLHELAHSVMAIRRGTPVLGITLFVFGGVAWMADEPRTPFDELLIAVVGPLASFLAAFLFGALWLATTGIAHLTRTSLLAPLVSAAGYLGAINGMLALFNLIPGFPLDGGRVLRALLWGGSGDYSMATRVASYVGQAIAWLFVATGSVWLVMSWLNRVGGYADALWLLFIGWFLNTTARSSRQQLDIRRELHNLHVGEIMRRNFQSFPPQLSLLHLMEQMVDPWSGALLWPVAQAGRLCGLLFRRDIEATPRSRWGTMTAGDLMQPRNPRQEVHPDDEAGKAFRLLQAQNVQFLPVVVDDLLVGLVYRHDLFSVLKRKT